MRKLKRRVSERNRIRKFDMVTSYIHPGDTVVDIGVSPKLNGTANYFEKWYNLPNKLTCLGLHDDFSRFKKEFPDFDLVTFDGFQFPSFENKFDIAFSNAVIEHVGNYDQQLKWLSGIARICKTLVITTPNRWLPFETHSMTFFIHWFPDKIRNAIYRKIGKARYANDYMWLLGASDLKRMLKEAGFDIVTFHKNRFLFFPIDFFVVCRANS